MSGADTFEFEVEAPHDWRRLPANFEITGWFEPGGTAIVDDIRAVVDGVPFLGVWGLVNPITPESQTAAGVSVSFRRFLIPVTANPGAHRVQLEIHIAGHDWVAFWQSPEGNVGVNLAGVAAPVLDASFVPAALLRLLRRRYELAAPPPSIANVPESPDTRFSLRELARKLAVEAASIGVEWNPSPPFHGHIDEPALHAQTQYDKLFVRGWVFHEACTIVRLFATCGRGPEMNELVCNQERWDVAIAYPGFESAATANFSGLVDIDPSAPDPVPLIIHAELEDGSLHTVFVRRFRQTPVVTDDRMLPPWSSGAFKRELGEFGAACSARGITLPERGALWQAVRHARRLFIESSLGDDRKHWRARDANTERSASDPLNSLRLAPDSTPTEVRHESLHLLLVTHNLNYEGAPLFLLEYARWMRKQEGWDITVASCGKGPLRTLFEELGAQVHIVDCGQIFASQDPKELESRIAGIKIQIPTGSVDLVVANTLVCWWAVFLAEAYGLPSLLYVHESVPVRRFFANRIEPHMQWVGHEALRRATRVSFLCEATRYIFEPLNDRGNFCTLPGWVDTTAIDGFKSSADRTTLRRKHGIGDDDIVITNIGTICARKGQHVFVRGASDFMKRHAAPGRQHRFLMVGGQSDDYQTLLLRDRDCLRVPGVEVISQTRDAYDFYALADALVCTSYEESFPRVLLEAMAFRLPFVSTNVHGIPEIVGATAASRLIRPGDHRALASAIRELLDRSSETELPEISARERVDRLFAATTVLPRHARLASEVRAVAPASGSTKSSAQIQITPEPQYLTLGDPPALRRARSKTTSAVERSLREEARSLAARPDSPRISVAVPVCDPQPSFLEELIATVTGQFYPKWELCMADDASTNSQIRLILDRAQATDPRIMVVRRPERGHIAEATNSAIGSATGDFIAFVDHDDLLTPDALYHFARVIMSRPGAGLLYSDEDKLDSNGRHFDPQFKGAWDPDMAITHNYVHHLLVVRRDLVERAGLMRTAFNGAQDLDLILRVVESLDSRQIAHVPHLCYHWRSHEQSTARRSDQKAYLIDAACRAIEAACTRRGLRAKPFLPPIAQSSAISLHQLKWSPSVLDENPVTIVIPTRDRITQVKRCIESLERTVNSRRVQVIIADGGSHNPLTLAGYREIVANAGLRTRILCGVEGTDPASQDHSTLLNLGAGAAETPLVLFLHDDVEAIEPGWLEDLAGWMSVEGVGVVGARLIRGNLLLDHAGIMLAPNAKAPITLFAGLGECEPGYLWLPHVARDCTSVSDACMITRVDLFRSLGGFDAAHFKRSFNDVDFCLRAADRGLRTVYTPQAVLRHEGCAVRPAPPSGNDLATFLDRHGARRDFYVSQHLTYRAPHLVPRP